MNDPKNMKPRGRKIVKETRQSVFIQEENGTIRKYYPADTPPKKGKTPKKAATKNPAKRQIKPSKQVAQKQEQPKLKDCRVVLLRLSQHELDYALKKNQVATLMKQVALNAQDVDIHGRKSIAIMKIRESDINVVVDSQMVQIHRAHQHAQIMQVAQNFDLNTAVKMDVFIPEHGQRTFYVSQEIFAQFSNNVESQMVQTRAQIIQTVQPFDLTTAVKIDIVMPDNGKRTFYVSQEMFAQLLATFFSQGLQTCHGYQRTQITKNQYEVADLTQALAQCNLSDEVMDFNDIGSLIDRFSTNWFNGNFDDNRNYDGQHFGDKIDAKATDDEIKWPPNQCTVTETVASDYDADAV